MTSEGRLQAVRDLHAPVISWYGQTCQGCDAGGYEAECPEWPCRTAALVFTTEEVEAVINGPRPEPPPKRVGLLPELMIQALHERLIRESLIGRINVTAPASSLSPDQP